MYYNLKIITKDSEFSLNSSDKSIIEREMDLYFASFFNVSENFKSQIKKPQITNNKTVEKSPETPKVRINSSNLQKAVQKAIQDSAREINNVTLPMGKKETRNVPEEANRKALEALERINETAINDIFLTQNNDSTPKPDVIKEEQKSDTYETIEDKEFEKEAEALFMELQNQVKNEADINKNAVENEAKIQENSNFNEKIPENITSVLENQNKVQDDILSVDVQKTDIPEFSFTDNILEQKEETINEPDSSGPFQDIVNEYREKGINTRNYAHMLEKQLSGIKNTKENIAPAEAIQEENNNKIHQEINAQNINFNAYLGGYKADKIEDEFLVCASYIKHVLNQSDFTMKYINSKLFQATGKIADTSIVDELIKMEYINNVPSDDFAKYTITEKGSNYLTTIQN